MRNEARIPLLKLLLSHFLYEVVKSVHIAFYSVKASRLQRVSFGTYYIGRQGHCSFNGNKPSQSLFKLLMPNGFPPIFIIQKHTPLSVQSLSCVPLFMTPWTAAHQASLTITNSQSLPKLMSIELVMPSNHLILCCPPFPPAFNLSQYQGLFQRVSSSHQVANTSASASVLPMNIQD